MHSQKQLESSFKSTINWNKYQSKITQQAQNQYLDLLIDPSFQGVNRLFILSFEDNINNRNKILQCHGRWNKLFWSISKKKLQLVKVIITQMGVY